MRRLLAPALPLALAACAPQNAEIIDGDFTAFIGATSITNQRAAVDYEGFDSYHKVDCRDFETARNERENERLRLEDRLRICPGDATQPDAFPPDHEIWLRRDGYHVVSSTLDPWRGEGVITSEGDFQVGFHQRLPGGEEFRVIFAVNPNFQPKTCVAGEDGDNELVDIDGDWVANWSEDLGPDEQGSLYYLTASAFQFNPGGPTGLAWFFPNEWGAGNAVGKFGDDLFRKRSPRFADPSVYIERSTDDQAQITRGNLFHCDNTVLPAGEDPATNPCMTNLINRVENTADEILEEYQAVQVRGADDPGNLPSWRPRVHHNLWRPVTGRPSGLDAWVELHYSWVRFDEGSVFEEGGSASGSFAIVFDAEDSQSRFFVRGNFNVKRWKNDIWVTDYLPTIKAEENGTTICGRVPPGR